MTHPLHQKGGLQRMDGNIRAILHTRLMFAQICADTEQLSHPFDKT
jgi:hypothetical protein